MSDFTVHGIPGSPYVRAVLLTLEEKCQAYHFAARPMGAHRAADYRSIHPFHKIPTLDHGDFRLYETIAILNYVNQVADGPLLKPAEPQAAARVDQVMSIALDYVTHRISATLSFQRRIAPLLGMPSDETVVASAIEPAREVLAELSSFLDDRDYIAGDQLSLGDLMVAPHLAFLRDYAEGRELLAAEPRLSAWLARMEARPSMAATTWDALIAKTGVNSKAAAEPLSA